MIINYEQLLGETNLVGNIDNVTRTIKMNLPDLMNIGALVEVLESRRLIGLKYINRQEGLWKEAGEEEDYAAQKEQFLNMTAIEVEVLVLSERLVNNLPENLQFLTEEE